MTSPAPFGRMLTAMATAFTDDGAVDLDGTAAIAHAPRRPRPRRRGGERDDGGEPDLQRARDRRHPARRSRTPSATGRRSIAGVGTNSTAHSIELAQQAEKLGADALLLVTPYYNKPGQAGVLHHFQQVVGATGTPGGPVRRARPHRHPDQPRDLRADQGRHRRGGQGRRRRLRPRRRSSSSWGTPSTAATTSPTSAGWPTARAA